VNTAICIAGIVLVVLVLRDIFDGILIPGRAHRRLRFIPLYFHATWAIWTAVGRRIHDDDQRERLLGVYGPLAMIGLLVLWAVGLMIGFAWIQAALTPDPAAHTFFEAMTATGSRMFTVGVGDWARSAPASKVLAVVVSGTGLGFFTMVITYMPVLYQLFSRRETHVIMLAERAGEPVSAVALIQNHARRHAMHHLDELLEDWEKWSAELLESHVSYPMLSYYRSPDNDQSWLSALAVVMDTCALRLSGSLPLDEFQAEATLAMSVKALDSIAEILKIKPLARYPDRLPRERFVALTGALHDLRLPLGEGDVWSRLSKLRDQYEPLLAAMSDYFVIRLPEWMPKAAIEAPLEAIRG
jgi:hypothetical protein